MDQQLVMTMDEFEKLYLSVREQARKTIFMMGWFGAGLYALLFDIKKAIVPHYRMPNAASPGFERARWFVTGIDGLVGAAMAVSLAVAFAALLTILSSDKNIVLNFLYTTIPWTGFIALYRTVSAIELFFEYVQLGNLESISPGLLNEAVYWFYIGVYLFTVFYLTHVEKKYLVRRYGQQ